MPAALDFPENKTQQLYLPGLEEHAESGIYKELIDNARNNGAEYPKIRDLFAFRESFTVHLAQFTQGVLRSPSSISIALRELIAASTSYQNECRFCTQAHAAAAAALYGDEPLVWSALTRLESSPLPEKEKALLRSRRRSRGTFPP